MVTESSRIVLDRWFPDNDGLTLADAAPVGYREPAPIPPPRLVEVLRQQIKVEPWRQDANCRDTHPDLFFSEPSDLDGLRQAKAVCEACTVSEQCLEYALTNGEKHGIWGGLKYEGTKGRRALMRDRLAAEREPLSTVEMPATGWPA